MLEIRYNKITGKLNAWNGDMRQAGNLKPRDKDEIVTIIDSDIPDADINAVLYDGISLLGNPEYAAPPEDSITLLEKRVKKLEDKSI